MTSRATETQTLIADIDRLLTNKRLSKFLSSQASEPRQVLERIRDYLVGVSSGDVQLDSTENQRSQQPQRSALLAKFVGSSNYQSLPEQNELKHEEIAAVEAVEENNSFSALLVPLQAELQALLQERATLVQEIRELEQRRLHNYSLAQQLANQEQIISEFLQVLMSRLVPNLTPQMAETLANSPLIQPTNWRGGINPLWTVSLGGEPSLELSAAEPFFESPDQVERLTQFARDLDQRLLALDGTVNVVFEALQRNIHTYHESLSQALARMHSQGLQGEHLLVSWINNLTTQLQQQTQSIEPSNADAKYETLNLTESSATNAAVQPTSTIDQLASLPELRQVSTSSSPINNHQQIKSEAQEDTPTTPDLYTALFQLDQNTQHLYATPTTAELHEDSSKLILDEVDQLYASLFGVDDLTDYSFELVANQATDELSVDVITSPSADTPPTPAIDQLQQVDSTVVMPDPWFAEPDAGLLDQSTPNVKDIQEVPVKVTEQSSKPQENTSASPRGVAAPNLVEERPASADTITHLTNLLADVDDSEYLLEVPYPVAASTEVAVTHMGRTRAETTSVVERSLDNYIPASSKENLLSQDESHQATGVPDISLEQAQLQQLEQDLANFDGELDSELQSVTISTIDITENPHNLENQETTETNTKVPQQVDSELDSATGSLFAESEEIASSEDWEPTLGLLSISNSTNNTEVNTVNSIWYLGIDLGTTGISAALLNRSTTEVYPLYWSAENQGSATSIAGTFRLPAEVYLPTTSVIGETQSKESIEQTNPGVVAEEKVPESAAAAVTHNVFSAQLKPYLQVAIPYKSEQQKWEPVLQLNEFSTVPLVWVVRSLSKLLLTLMSDRNSTTLGLTAAAVGLNQETFRSIISNITGVICSCPSNWSEQYRFNLREALLISKLVQHPQQVFFVEEAIASLLSELDGANGEKVTFRGRPGFRSAKTNDHPLFGSTLIINIGAAATEMTLVDLPENMFDLTHNDFMLHSFAYAGKGIDQDIICQLLFPPKWRQSRNDTHSDSENITSNPKHWQPAIPGLDQMHLSSLGWEELNLPRPGEPDISDRICLQQRLESSLLGKALLDAAIALKLILQDQESFTLELAQELWVLHRRDLESQVFVPFVRRLNRELNRLLVAKGIPTEAINQAILTGGVASLGAVSRWLRQKLPNAKIIQDLYLGENGSTCSRVAYGLAMLPLHPQVLEVPRQQYTDYFLLTELLRLLPDRAVSFSEVIQLFESRGINTRSCQQRLLAFLESELPPGLIPSVLDSTWLTQSSFENSDYKALQGAPLFEKQGSLTYRPNSEQLRFLRRYLNAIKASTQQSLEEPYTVNFALGAVTH